MKDVTSTAFGLLIAFLLPGFVGLYTLTFWSPTVRHVFDNFQTAQSTVGLSLLVVLAALAAGLEITALRWVLFESWRSKRSRLKSTDFALLGLDEGRLSAFRAAVDEHYRYHQFWGGMSIVMPFFYFGLQRGSCADLPMACGGWGLFLFSVVEAVTIVAACEAYRMSVGRAKEIMKGGNNA